MRTYDDSKWINSQNISAYANTNEEFLNGKVCGIVIELPGLGGGSCFGGSVDRGVYDSPETRAFAQNGIVVAYMFPGPWSWGNRAAVRMTDAVVAALCAKYNLGDNPPIVVSGGSMGGIGALNYARYSRYTLTAVAVACPCVDVLDRFNCHPDFPRTYISAVAGYDMPLEDALKEISPMEQVAHMPHVPYYISSDAEDDIFPEALCDKYVDMLRAEGHDVQYYHQPGIGHGGFLPEVWQGMQRFIINAILSAQK